MRRARRRPRCSASTATYQTISTSGWSGRIYPVTKPPTSPSTVATTEVRAKSRHHNRYVYDEFRSRTWESRAMRILVANLVTDLLGLGPVEGSQLDAEQDLDVAR